MIVFFGMGIGIVCFRAGADPLEPDPENAADSMYATGPVPVEDTFEDYKGTLPSPPTPRQRERMTS